MRVLVTGHNGYIGSVMVGVLTQAGHDVTGLDTYLYEGCTFGDDSVPVPSIRKDVRDVEPRRSRGFDAVIHLAALSNDPLGYLNERLHLRHQPPRQRARWRRPRRRPAFRGSCSRRRAASTAPPATTMLDEKRRVQSDHGVRQVEGAGRAGRRQARRAIVSARRSCATRRPTALSPRLRADIVVNNLVGVAFTTGEVFIQSDGTPWRPLVHIEDISRAFLAVLEAPRELVHNQAFNVGSSEENYQVRDVADIVQEVVPGCRSSTWKAADRIRAAIEVELRASSAKTFPAFKTEWTVRRGAQELYDALRAPRPDRRDSSPSFMRIKRIQELHGGGPARRLAALADGGKRGLNGRTRVTQQSGEDVTMKVVLFCGGLGMRIREAGENMPKPMVTIGYRPILWHVMKYYAHFGHKDFVLCLGYRGDVIKNYFLNYSECLSNDFMLSEGGKKLELMGSDIHDWKITFVETGLQLEHRPAPEGRRAVSSRDEPEFLANYSDGLTQPAAAGAARRSSADRTRSRASSASSRTSATTSSRPMPDGRVTAIEDIAQTPHPHQRRLLHPQAARSSTTCGDGEELVRRAVPAPGRRSRQARGLRVRRLLDVDGHVQGPPAARRDLRDAATRRGRSGTRRRRRRPTLAHVLV